MELINNKRVILLVVDSLGVGYMDDVALDRRQDIGANTFYHILDRAKNIKIPVFEKLGINKILNHPRLGDDRNLASFGTLNLKHYGADSYAGHQEIMGSSPKKPVMKPFTAYMDRVRQALETSGCRVEIPDPEKPYLLVDGLAVVGDNIETDYGQIYNITAPLDYMPFEQVYKIGMIVRENVDVNRVIALGGRNISPQHLLDSIEKREDGLVGVNSPKSGVYKEGYKVRHIGYGVNPDNQIENILARSGREVVLIGKMQDVISCEAAVRIPAVKTDLVLENILQSMDRVSEGFIAATVQETDLAGHAQDVELYAEKIMLVDRYLDIIMSKMTEHDILMVTADHGNDPTIGHSQHTREKTFILVYGKSLNPADLGERDSLSDVAATIADYFHTDSPENGKSFYDILMEEKYVQGHTGFTGYSYSRSLCN